MSKLKICEEIYGILRKKKQRSRRFSEFISEFHFFKKKPRLSAFDNSRFFVFYGDSWAGGYDMAEN